MRYALVVITHGEAKTLPATVESFYEYVSPLPSVRLAVIDGPGNAPPIDAFGCWEVTQHERQLGFCEAVNTGWLAAKKAVAAHDLDYVFWLENDFRFFLPINLERVAAVLAENRELAQMAFMRQAVNDAEKAAGGIVASRPGQFTDMDGWLKQDQFWTTNPSLIPARVVLSTMWPQGPHCEGKFGFILRDYKYSFGFWGSGETWVTHIGHRDGHGY